MKNVFDYIKTEENNYQQVPITVIEGYEWSMYKHCRLTTLYLNSKYESGNSDNKPYKNIILDKINLQHRAIEFDVKDIQVYVDNPENYYKSLLTRKYHAKWARENNLGTFIDELAEVFTDFGGVLVRKNSTEPRPEVIPFNKIAFVDQTDILSGAICLKHFYTPSQMKKEKWNQKEVDYVIQMAAAQPKGKETAQTKQIIKTPTNYIEVYELHGELPLSFLKEDASETEFSRQMHIVAFYKDPKGERQGVTLYSGTQLENPFKFTVRDKIYGRALGRGGVEELFEDQVWVNYNEIQQKELLDQASKIVYQTADKGFATRNKNTDNLQQGQTLITEEGKPLSQLNTQPVSLPLFANASERWDNHAKTVSGAFDTISGEQSKSGMPFRLGMLLNQEAHSLHLYRKEKLSMFVQEIYRDWILKWLVKEMQNEQVFMDTLSLDEMEQIATSISTQQVNDFIKEKFFKFELPTPEEVEAMRQSAMLTFKMGGNRKFFKILKGELNNLPLDVDIIISGEQRNNALVAEKLSSIFSQIAQNPGILDNPDMRKLFNEILEASGVSPLSISSGKASPSPTPQIPVESPPQELSNNAVGETATV